MFAKLRKEPALLGALVTIATTLSVSLPSHQGELGIILSAVQAVLAVGVRSQVTPTVALPATGGTITTPVVPDATGGVHH